MKVSALSRADNVLRASQGSPGKHAVSFPSPTLQQMPVSQLNNSKKSILPPQDEQFRSEIVPDLSTFMVAEIIDADTGEKKEKILMKLYKYLIGMGAVESPQRTKITYKDKNDSHYADTWLSGENDNDPLEITFFKNAFDEGPAALYSIFRHELIHVSQRLKVPRSEEEGGTEAEDKFMHENIYDDYVGKDTEKTIQIPLMEIETHVWELQHRFETGISKNEKYLKETFNYLSEYAIKLLTSVTKLPKRQVMYWKNYIHNAIILLKSLGDDTLNGHALKLAGALEKQEQKKDAKNAGKLRKKKSEDEVAVVDEVEIVELDLENQEDAQTVNTGIQVEDKGWIFKTYQELSSTNNNTGLGELKEMMEVNMDEVPSTWKTYYGNYIQKIDNQLDEMQESDEE